MHYFKKIILFTFFVTFQIYTYGQYNANSIYSRYGIGDIDRSGFVQSRALGGLAIPLRDQGQINFLNPASYNVQDTSSFLWDIGLFGTSTNSKTSQGSSRRSSVNFDHLAISFPISQYYYVSAGLLPFSNMGYNLRRIETEQSTYNQTLYLYKGSGNINQFYLGQSIGLLKKKLNLGVNVSYLFGSLNIENGIEFYELGSGLYSTSSSNISSRIENRYFVRGLNFSFGAQEVIKLRNNIILNIGATYDPRTRLKTENSSTTSRFSLIMPSDTILNIDTTSRFSIPGRLGIGFSLTFNNRLLLGFDYTIQDWSKSTFPTFTGQLNASHRLNFGMQFTPEKTPFVNYFSRVNYRIGGYFNDTYLNLNGHFINEYGITFGLGLPFKKTGTTFNLSFEIGSRGTKSDNLMKIDFGRITLGLSLLDKWFVKKKYF
jgi:hypothetical protein